MIFNEGICQTGEIIDIGVEKGIVDKAGAWYSFRGERMGQGREGSKTFLKENLEVRAEIRSLILSTLGISDETGDGADLALASADALEDAPKKASKGKKKEEMNGAPALEQ